VILRPVYSVSRYPILHADSLPYRRLSYSPTGMPVELKPAIRGFEMASSGARRPHGRGFLYLRLFEPSGRNPAQKAIHPYPYGDGFLLVG